MRQTMSKVSKVSDVIKVLNGGIEFYEEAREKVSSVHIKHMFNRMITAKQNAVSALQPFAVAENGEIEDDTSLAVDLRSFYTKLLGSISTDKEHTYVDQLEEVEDKLLDALDDALKCEQPPQCAIVLRKVKADMQVCHDEMKALQRATA
ncbi:PA2169 family four-helix-bundle protein [Bowmanella sp. Y26]|nr:PA2169 family four-helix-bundle protein [Bowmanella yangjiangensis]